MAAMANEQAAAPQQHDLSVPYADVVVPGSDIDIMRWESWSYTHADRKDYYAKGPCPACFAEAQGHAADIQEPVEAQGRRQRDAALGKAVLGDTIEIPVRCQCGFGHGKQDATNCGRAWSLIVTRTTS
jgi:hypothetical protein